MVRIFLRENATTISSLSTPPLPPMQAQVPGRRPRRPMFEGGVSVMWQSLHDGNQRISLRDLLKKRKSGREEEGRRSDRTEARKKREVDNGDREGEQGQRKRQIKMCTQLRQ